MAKKIYIDPGHGGADCGAAANGLRESDVNLKIAVYMRDILQECGIETKLCRTGDVGVTLLQRTTQANAWGADLFFSIHNNGASTETAKGFEVYYFAESQNGKRLADLINAEAGLLNPSRGVKPNTGFYVLKNSKMPAVLTEGAFLTNVQDAARLKDEGFLKTLAGAYAKAACAYLGVAYKETTPPAPAGSSGPLYRVQVGAFKNKANAQALAEKIKNDGYEAIVAEVTK